MIAVHDVSGLVLAGGQGRRMQQADQPVVEKGLMRLHGKPLVAWAADAMPNGLANLYISANRYADDYAKYGIVVPDIPALADDRGPLAGVASAMQIIDTQWIYIVPVDVPCPPSTVFSRLFQHVSAHSCDLAFACTDRPQPLFMLVNKKMLPSLERYLQGGFRQVQRWQQDHGCAVHFNESADDFFNVNTPHDLQRAHQLITSPH